MAAWTGGAREEGSPEVFPADSALVPVQVPPSDALCSGRRTLGTSGLPQAIPGVLGKEVRVVKRRATRRRIVHPFRSSRDWPDVESGMDTLTERFKTLTDGDNLYPWSNTVLRIESETRRWVAKQAADY